MDDWAKAKRELDEMSFPEDIKFHDTKRHEEHSHKKELHKLLTYENTDPIIVNGYDCVAKYNFCTECNQVRNKALVIFNNEDNVCHEKVFKFHGKDPKENKLMEDMATIFSSLLVFFAI